MELFAHGRQAQIEKESPLANRMRPRTLDEFVGQEHILGPGRLLRRAIQADQLSSLIFYGPPGTGKTTLAMVIANTTESHFITINAVLAGVKEIREAIATAVERRDLYGQRTTLFVDEVHRWNKAQQDALLPHVENGTIILIGATTENPYFEVNKALVSRSRIFQLRPLTPDHLRQIALNALADPERGYGALNVDLHADALDHLVDVANGDARGVLNALELAVETTPPNEEGVDAEGVDAEGVDAEGVIVVDLEVAEESIQRRAVLYDKDGDVHYDTISAFIKSLRGSDPDAALYWMARMVYAGEDPRFIFRRMAIFAGEDVGMADPQAINVVVSCWEAFERLGLPEGRYPLALAAIYLSTAPKSNSAFAFFDALGAVEKEQETAVPKHLKDGSRDKEGFGHGQGYLYPHAYRDHWVAQQYLPDALQGKVFYQPGDLGYERQIRDEVTRRREAQLAAMVERDTAAFEDLWTTGPANRGRDAWLQRAIAGNSKQLSRLRERIFELAAVQRHHLVLDVNAGSGLLAWEAVRHAPEGGVWALTAEANAGEALRQQAERLPEIERPSVLIGEVSELDYLLALRDEEDVRFDRILGRNPLSTAGSATRQAIWQVLATRLLPGGRLCFSQTIPRRGQRLYQLVDWTGNEELRAKVEAAEEAIYADPDDPLVNWDATDLEADLRAVGEWQSVQVSVETQTEQRRITVAHLSRWFGESEGDGRRSYGQRLLDSGLTAEECKAVETRYRRQLLEQTVDWGTAVAYLLAII
jgi:putative ATPase